MRFLSLAGIVSIFFMSACSNQISVDGSVFVEHNGKATKLALVDIQVIPENVFRAHVRQQLIGAEVEERRIQESIEKQQKSLENIRRSFDETYEKTMEHIAMGRSSYGEAIKSRALLEQALDTIATSEKSISSMRNEIVGLRSGANSKFFYPTELQDKIQKLTSDADGNFKVTLQKGERSVLAATKNGYYWLIWIDTKKINAPIALTNKNLNGTACGDCVFSESSTPSSL